MNNPKGGRIVRLKLKNFMTYDEFEIKPILGLNLIVGFNGSGKSSLMCAICLGLAGLPKHTGKNAQIADFIKHGKDEAMIEIELENSTGCNIVIRRIIRGNQSHWFLNRASVKDTEITATVKKFNIDLSNLCQFLPQEKVVEFSKMTKNKRLENLLQAIGEPQLVSLFEELKELRKKVDLLQGGMEKVQSQKEVETQKNERLRGDVRKNEDRKFLKEQLNLLKHIKMAMQYNDYRKKIDNLKSKKKELKTQEKIFLNEFEKIKNEDNEVQSQNKAASLKITELKQKTSALYDKINNLSRKLTELQENAEFSVMEFQSRIKEKAEQQAKLAELKKQIEGLLKMKSESEPMLQETQVKIAKNNQEYQSVRGDLSAVESELENINVQMNSNQSSNQNIVRKINHLRNEQNKKLEHIKVRFSDLYQAVCWFQQNKSSFKSEICLPAMLSMQVQNSSCNKYIENLVGQRDLLAFVCAEKEDVKRLSQVLLVEKQLIVNIALVPDPVPTHSPNITQELRQYGIECFVQDICTAPELIKRYLCKLYNIHQVPICNQQAENFIDQIRQHFSKFYLPNEKVTCIKSRYGNRNVSVKRDHVVDRKLLPNSEDNSEELKQLESQHQKLNSQMTELTKQHTVITTSRSGLERILEQLRGEKTSLNGVLNKIKNVEQQIRQKMEIYQQKKKDTVNEEEEKTRLQRDMLNCNRSRMNILVTMEQYLKEFHSLKKEKVKLILSTNLFSMKIRLLRQQIQLKEQEHSKAIKDLEDIRIEMDNLVNKAKELMTILKGSTYLPKIQKKEEKSMDDIETDIAKIQAQLELNCEENDLLVHEFKDREKHIKSLEEQSEEFSKEFQVLNSEMARKKELWMKPLQNHISNINVKFGNYYKFLHCAGEISLDATEDSDDFPNYGLQIRLKYRENEPFNELSQTHHSGGECSVAAIIFILSLQELTQVPFRCIDEINQGMDNENEKKMYDLIAQMIADAAEKGVCSQYFLLTPKLLLDLKYSEDVAIHMIFGSKFQTTKLDVKKDIKTGLKR